MLKSDARQVQNVFAIETADDLVAGREVCQAANRLKAAEPSRAIIFLELQQTILDGGKTFMV
jgi:hypothetical protein